MEEADMTPSEEEMIELAGVMPSAHRGAANEMLAAGWLMKQGWLVCRNVSPTGIVDLMALRVGDEVEIGRFDVKSRRS
jgi:Holliday junction resolvase-like predicted endonuclease